MVGIPTSKDEKKLDGEKIAASLDSMVKPGCWCASIGCLVLIVSVSFYIISLGWKLIHDL